MNNSKIKQLLTVIIFFVAIILSTTVWGTTNDEIQILKSSDKEYMIYVSEHYNLPFEFAFSNSSNDTKEELTYKISAKDSQENEVAYVDAETYTKYFNKKAYLWARTTEGEYFVKGLEIDLQNSITLEDVNLANNITKIIDVNTKNTYTTEEMQGEVEVTKTVGKVDILEEGTTYYQLVKLPSTDSHNELMKIAKKISNNKVENNIYAKLKIISRFSELYKELAPKIEDKNWIKLENDYILQPEDAKQDEEYILWLKTETQTETKMDAQFLTCFEDYKPKVISEKIVSKLPVTYDNPILFIILAILIVAFIAVLIIKVKTTKKDTKQ